MILYRFSRKCWLEDFKNKGLVSFGRADSYLKSELTEAQKDDEHTRILKPDITKTKLSIEGHLIHGLKDLVINLTARDASKGLFPYHMLCFATTFNEKLYGAFNGDACLEIHNTDEFFEILSRSLIAEGWEGKHSFIDYYDPDKLVRLKGKGAEKIIFSKEARYKYQNEYRIAITHHDRSRLNSERVQFILGDLSHICTIHTKT